MLKQDLNIGTKGFSVIEVIICLAIMAVLSTGAVSLASHIKYANTKKCVKLLNQELETARMTAMSKAGNWQLYVYRKEDGIYYYLSNSGLNKEKGEKVGGKKIHLYYKKKGETEQELTSVDSSLVQIQFSKNTGAFIAESGSCIYETLRVATVGTNGHVIKLIEVTGKHILD